MGVLIDPAKTLLVAKAIKRQGFVPARGNGEALDLSRLPNTTTIGILLEEEKRKMSRWEKERRRLIGSLSFNGERSLMNVYGTDVYLLVEQLARKLEQEFGLELNVINVCFTPKWEYLPSDDKYD